MAREYTYKGLSGNWHEWTMLENGELFPFYRHIQDEAIREDLVEKYRSLGFSDKMIQIILGQEILFGLQNFTTRDQNPPGIV